MDMWLYGWQPLCLGHLVANFGGFSYCASEDKKLLIYYMISKDHVSQALRDFMGGNPW